MYFKKNTKENKYINCEEYISNKIWKTNAGTGPPKQCWLELISIVEILLNPQIIFVTYDVPMCTKHISGYL